MVMQQESRLTRLLMLLAQQQKKLKFFAMRLPLYLFKLNMILRLKQLLCHHQLDV
jgi:hypothetical protein